MKSKLLLSLLTLFISGSLLSCSVNKPHFDIDDENASENEDEIENERGTVNIIPSDRGEIIANKYEGEVGEEIELTIKPFKGYIVHTIKRNEDVLNVNNNKVKFNLVSGVNTIQTKFVVDDDYTLDVVKIESFSIDRNIETKDIYNNEDFRLRFHIVSNIKYNIKSITINDVIYDDTKIIKEKYNYYSISFNGVENQTSLTYEVNEIVAESEGLTYIFDTFTENSYVVNFVEKELNLNLDIREEYIGFQKYILKGIISGLDSDKQIKLMYELSSLDGKIFNSQDINIQNKNFGFILDDLNRDITYRIKIFYYIENNLNKNILYNKTFSLKEYVNGKIFIFNDKIFYDIKFNSVKGAYFKGLDFYDINNRKLGSFENAYNRYDWLTDINYVDEIVSAKANLYIGEEGFCDINLPIVRESETITNQYSNAEEETAYVQVYKQVFSEFEHCYLLEDKNNKREITTYTENESSFIFNLDNLTGSTKYTMLFMTLVGDENPYYKVYKIEFQTLKVNISPISRVNFPYYNFNYTEYDENFYIELVPNKNYKKPIDKLEVMINNQGYQVKKDNLNNYLLNVPIDDNIVTEYYKYMNSGLVIDHLKLRVNGIEEYELDNSIVYGNSVNFHRFKFVDCKFADRNGNTINEINSNSSNYVVARIENLDEQYVTKINGNPIVRYLDPNRILFEYKYNPETSIDGRIKIYSYETDVVHKVDYNFRPEVKINYQDEVTHIKSANDFINILGTKGHFVLDNDIDLNGIDYIKDASINETSGIFDGRGYSIKNSYIIYDKNNEGANTPIGIFPNFSNGTIKNLVLDNIKIELKSMENFGCGILAGNVNHTTISNVNVLDNCEIKLHGEYFRSTYNAVGGLVGKAIDENSLDIKSSSTKLNNCSISTKFEGKLVQGNMGFNNDNCYIYGVGAIFGSVKGSLELKDIYNNVSEFLGDNLNKMHIIAGILDTSSEASNLKVNRMVYTGKLNKSDGCSTFFNMKNLDPTHLNYSGCIFNSLEEGTVIKAKEGNWITKYSEDRFYNEEYLAKKEYSDEYWLCNFANYKIGIYPTLRH